MNTNKEKNKLHMKSILQGSLLILITNLIYVGNNYLVSWTGLAAPEVALVRGTIQIMVFGSLVWRSRENRETWETGEKGEKGDTEMTEKTGHTGEEEETGETVNIYGRNFSRLRLFAWLVLYGFTISTVGLACLAAIPYMPIGDLIVICFTSPVFSVFLDRIVNKRLFTILSISLCFFIIVGDILVIQPPFIFTKAEAPHNKNQSLTTEETRSDVKRGQNYYLGVALCFYAAMAASVANVVASKCSKLDISTSKLMFVCGCFSVFFSLVSTSFLTNRIVTNPTSLPIEAAVLLPVSAFITMVAYWTFTLAISITGNPTLIAMLRSTEILISLVTECIWWSQIPGSLSLVGTLLVFLCVISMAAHDKIILIVRRNFGPRD